MMDFADLDVALELRLPAVAGELVRQGLDRARAERWAERLHDRDTSLWSSDERVQAEMAKWLGWLDAPEHFSARIAALEGFGDGIRDAGFTTAVVMGMGGSSLAAETLGLTFGTTPGYLEQRILDSTHPVAVSRTVDDLAPLATLWIVSTKSGRTTESLAFEADAWARVDAAREREDVDGSPGQWLIAVTDPGRSLDTIPHHDDLREVFLNPPEIGGRFSALSYPGLVPAALIGIDLDALLASASSMLARTREPEPARNPGLALGVALGTLARAGRNKVTFVVDPEIAAFGPWVEQLLAESTGKHGTGLIPIDAEPLGRAEAYDDDRVFVRIRQEGSSGPSAAAGGVSADELIGRLEAAGHPVIHLSIADPIDLGGEFVRWEVATAIAGAVLGVDPFDQPNVEESKELTRRLLAESPPESDGEGAAAEPEAVRSGELAFHPDAALRLTGGGDGTLVGELRRHLARRRPSAYLAIQAFLAPSPETDAALARIRALLRDATRCATTAGYGPRYLHSTGQLHKGGPPIGWFLQLTDDHGVEREIPGWPYTFGELIDAQARGDFAALEAHDLPVARVHLGADAVAGLAALESALEAALRGAPDQALEPPRP
jgi:glucose-6-phosphate isomerase